MSDDEFEPRLGRLGEGRRADRALGRSLAATRRAGGGGGGRSGRFDGSRIGRGASMARILSRRPAGRRVLVKARLVRLGGPGLATARAHMRYIRRDGVTRDGQPGELYRADADHADGRAFLERAREDRHQFRFIVSAEDGDRYEDLKPLVRRLMAQAEADLGTRLDWVAVDHFNTGHPHSHILVRGVDETGANLVIARDYIGYGLRARAEELVTLDLGPRTQLEIEDRRRHDVTAERLTPLDRSLIAASDDDHHVGVRHPDPAEQSLRVGRLRKLEALGLARPEPAGRWRLDPALAERLRALGERGDILRAMYRDLREAGRDYTVDAQRIYDPHCDEAAPLAGRIARHGLADEHRDRRYLLVEGLDGHAYHVDIGEGAQPALPATGAVVEIRPHSVAPRGVDLKVAEVAAVNAGRYSVDLHLRHDPQASEAFAETHVRRLEAIRRAGGAVTRDPDGGWRIGPDHPGVARAYEAARARRQPVEIHILSARPIGDLRTTEAATWIDRTLTGDDPHPIRDAGFGAEVRAVQRQRQQWLLDEQLAVERGTGIAYRADLLATLRRRELLRIADQLSGELGLAFAEARPGMAVEGRLVRAVGLADGRMALVERARDFTLVPWRPAMERQLGRQVAGVVREGGISFALARGRGAPEIE